MAASQECVEDADRQYNSRESPTPTPIPPMHASRRSAHRAALGRSDGRHGARIHCRRGTRKNGARHREEAIVAHRVKLGYKASAEQFGPRELVELGVLAEARGMDSATVSDQHADRGCRPVTARLPRRGRPGCGTATAATRRHSRPPGVHDRQPSAEQSRHDGRSGGGIVKLLAFPSLCDDRRSWPLQRRTNDSGIRARSSPTVCGSTTASR